MSIILPNASASDLSGLSGGASDSSDTSASPTKHRRRCDDAAAFLQPGTHLPRYACPQCALRFRRRDALDRHVAQHTGVRKFRCTLRPGECDRIYSCSSHLRRHVRTAHPTVQRRSDGDGDAIGDGSTTTVRCSQPGCPRRFTTPAAMALHAAQTHQKRRQHQCAECPEAFYRKQQLRAHQMKHTGVYPYRCGACADGFISKRLLERHRTGCKPVETAARQPGEASTATASAAQSKNRCEVCDRTFAKWSELVAHRRTEHRPQCALCTRTFSTLANRKMHMHSVHGAVAAETEEADTAVVASTSTFVCTEPECGKVFAHERNLNAHWRLKHGSVRFACDRCGLELSSKKKLELHGDWHRRHPDYVVRPAATKTNKGSFSCEAAGCGRIYVRRQALVEHVRKVHGDEEIVVPAARQQQTVAEKLAGVRVEEMEGMVVDDVQKEGKAEAEDAA